MKGHESLVVLLGPGLVQLMAPVAEMHGSVVKVVTTGSTGLWAGRGCRHCLGGVCVRCMQALPGEGVVIRSVQWCGCTRKRGQLD